MLGTLVSGLCFTMGVAAAPRKAPPDALVEFRNIASVLLKSGLGLDTGLALEYQFHRTDGLCKGREPEIHLRLHGDGRLDLFRTRSWAESDRSGPGRFQGRIGKAAWDSLLLQVSDMKWEEEGGLPLPGIAESDQVILLHAGGRTASFDFGGPVPKGQERIRNGLGAVTGLLQPAEKDTVWSLALGHADAKYRKGRLKVRAVWSLRGILPLRFRLPAPGRQPECGIVALRWTLQPKDVQGFTAVSAERNWAYPGSPDKEAGAWKEIQPGDSIAVAYAFPLPKPKNAARVEREGSLMHLGFPVAFAGSADTLAVVTLFSGYFRF